MNLAGAREQVVEIGDTAMGDPGLLAGDPVAVVGRGRFAGQRRRVGSGLWLGKAVGTNSVAAQHVWQPVGLLPFGPERHQRVAGQAVHADRDGHCRPARGNLLEGLKVDLVGLATAAPLLGVGQAQQPA